MREELKILIRPNLTSTEAAVVTAHAVMLHYGLDEVDFSVGVASPLVIGERCTNPVIADDWDTSAIPDGSIVGGIEDHGDGS